jgi:Flp pilus assembly protein TadG
VKRRSRGQALAEFALILPILLLLLLGIVDMGRLIYAYNAVSNAAREGGRTAIVNQVAGEVRGKAAEQATALGLVAADPGGCPPAGGPTTTQPLGVCFVLRNRDNNAACPGGTSIGCTAVVAVKWEYKAITPIIGDLIGQFSVSSTTRQLVESVCTTAGSCPR